jgi:anaerobic selenocysteine-containing dehydrogenase
MPEGKPGIPRRDFLKKAAITGVGAAWAAPVIQTVAATKAYAHDMGSPETKKKKKKKKPKATGS